MFTAHTAIKNDPRLIWNMDETDRSGEYCQKSKVFCASISSAGGYRVQKGKAVGKHVTAVVIANAAGKVLLPFIIFEGKQEQMAWFEPLKDGKGRQFKDSCGERWWFSKEKWFQEMDSPLAQRMGQCSRILFNLSKTTSVNIQKGTLMTASIYCCCLTGTSHGMDGSGYKKPLLPRLR